MDRGGNRSLSIRLPLPLELSSAAFSASTWVFPIRHPTAPHKLMPMPTQTGGFEFPARQSHQPLDTEELSLRGQQRGEAL